MLGIVRLLLALQAVTLVCPLTENGVLQTKTSDIHPQGFRSVTAEEAPELLNNDVYELSFVEGREQLRGTGSHPLYSLSRDDWVRIRDLQVGERLQTAEGAVTVEALEKVRGVHRVYNLEVEGDHEYLVGEAGVRAHNGCGDIALGRDIPGAGMKALADATDSTWYRYWAKAGITRRTVDNHFGRAFHQAVERANTINFSLDGISDVAAAVRRGRAGFRRDNITNAELHYIATNPGILSKTKFFRTIDGVVTQVPSPF